MRSPLRVKGTRSWAPMYSSPLRSLSCTSGGNASSATSYSEKTRPFCCNVVQRKDPPLLLHPLDEGVLDREVECVPRFRVYLGILPGVRREEKDPSLLHAHGLVYSVPNEGEDLVELQGRG